MLKKWKVLEFTKKFTCKWFSIYQEKCKLPTGRIIDDYYISSCHDIATIIAFDKDKNILLLREYKHGIKDIIWTFPSGIIEENEDPLAGAKRELMEETGYDGDLKLIAKTYPNPTSGRFAKYTYLAQNCRKIGEQNLDSTEFLEVHRKSITEISELIKNGSLNTDLNISSFYKALLALNIIEINPHE